MKSQYSISINTTILYAVTASLWILFSDQVLLFITSDSQALSEMQTYKGLFFVLFTSVLLYFVIHRQISTLEKERSSRHKAEMQLNEKEKLYQTLFENSGEAVMLTDPAGTIISANPAACTLFGMTEEEIRTAGRNGITDVSDPRLAQAIETRNQTGMFKGELTFRRKDGTNFPAECSTNLFSDHTGAVRTSMIIRDLTERKKSEEEFARFQNELEQRVEERTEALNAVNADLESFNYSVSHDLRAPIRAIDSFTAILMQEHSSGMPDDFRKLLANVRINTKKMDLLINGLLSLSRIGRQELTIETVPMEKLARETVEEILRGTDPNRITVTVHPLPDAECDPVLMRQVWFNILSNAVKYSSYKEHAIIDITSAESDESIAYSVKDNGVGFSMKHANKLFGIFQRLHRADEFEGVGIGLSIVKRVVSRSGGSVSAAGEEGAGATITFTLPKHRHADKESVS